MVLNTYAQVLVAGILGTNFVSVKYTKQAKGDLQRQTKDQLNTALFGINY